MKTVDTIVWSRYPMLRLLLALVLGIILTHLSSYKVPPFWLAIGLVVFVPIVFIIIRGPVPFKGRTLMGVVLLFWVLALGSWRASFNYDQLDPNHFQHQLSGTDNHAHYVGEVVHLKHTSKYTRLTLNVNAQLVDTVNYSVSGRALLYIPYDSLSRVIELGNSLLFRAKLQRIAPPKNPDAFDFAAWQARQYVFHQAFVGAKDWQLQDTIVSLRGYAERWRQRLYVLLSKQLYGHPNELAVTAALVLGLRNEVSDEVRNAYAETGAVHVLAVSGLHVGIVLIGLRFFLGARFFQQTYGRWIALALTLLGVWSFAVLSGLAPSVQRAALMFSFIEIGRQLHRRSSGFNAVGASAFVLLMWDPQLLFNIGFQLSYLAVLGILFFQPRIYRWWYSKHRIGRQLWSLISVALAAQLVTFPLSLYYFHQFPVYFLLTGIAVVSLAGIIVYVTIGLFILSWWAIAAQLLGKVLAVIVGLNNAIVFGVQSLPLGLIKAVWVSGFTVLGLYLALWFLARWSVRRSAKYAIWLLSILVGIGLMENWHNWQHLQQHRLVIYHTPKHSLVDMMNGTELVSWSDDLLNNPQLLRQAVPHREHHGIRQQTSLPEYEGGHIRQLGPVIGFRQKRLLILTPTQIIPENVQTLQADVVLLHQNPSVPLDILSQRISAPHWVADASNDPWQIKSWQAAADTLGLSLHYTGKEGAFILNF